MAVKIISHRGANRLAPQNTLPAFEAALKIGVDGFETDVHLTADGVPVICHNYKVNETSDGTGKISAMTYDEFKSYDFGGYFSPEFKGTTAPSLDEFLRLCLGADLEIINIELKPSLENDMSVVSKTIQMVKDYGLSDKLLI
ncbi:MAG: glycerophosphodiester phosphodiesterase, partial [Acutalibacteraceae bacterium]